MEKILSDRPSGLYFPSPADIIEVVKGITVDRPVSQQISYQEFHPNDEQRKWLAIQEKYVWYGWGKLSKDKTYKMSGAGMRQFAIDKYKIDPEWYDRIAKQIPE